MRALVRYRLVAGLCVAFGATSTTLWSQSPSSPKGKDTRDRISEIIPVQRTAPQEVTPTMQPESAPITAPSTIEPAKPADNTQTTVPTNTAASQANNASDVSSLISKSEEGRGVEVQQRNAIVSDPRVRGLRNGQYLATGDGATFYPARLDLDSPVSKFTPGAIRNVRVFRGPYTTMLGPGFAFLDIETADSPRARAGCGTEVHGATSGGYQTNGERVNALQTFSVAGERGGVIGSYNVLTGNDYRAGDGTRIPASHLAHNYNISLGYDLGEKTTLEFKAMGSFLSNVEFPGLYFDIDSADTQGYLLRIRSRDIGAIDEASATVWYNQATGYGNTTQGAKQLFTNSLLAAAFSEVRKGASDVPYQFRDSSTTSFDSRSIGYRLAARTGNGRDQLSLTFGHDLNVFSQSLTETIRFEQLAGPGLNGNPAFNRYEQNQSIPRSDAVDPGIFFEVLVPVTDNLTFKGGGRGDYVRTGNDGPRLITGNIDVLNPLNQGPVPGGIFPINTGVYSTDPSNTSSLGRSFTLASGFTTLEYQIVKEMTAYANYGYAERAPTLTELYATGPFIGVLQQGTSRLIGDPNLKKEQMHQIETGVRYDSRIIKAGISGYHSWITNYITYDANKLSAKGLSQVVFTNTDLATIAGTEAYLSVRTTDFISPFATLSYVQGVDQSHADRRRDANLASSRRNDPATRQYASETEPLPQIPPLESRVGFRLHSSEEDPRWQVEFAARIVKGQNSVASSLGELATSGFTTFDIRGYWKPRDTLLLIAGVENIGDKLYREHLDPIAANTLRQNGYPGVPPFYRPGTNVFFSTQLSY